MCSGRNRELPWRAGRRCTIHHGRPVQNRTADGDDLARTSLLEHPIAIRLQRVRYTAATHLKHEDATHDEAAVSTFDAVAKQLQEHLFAFPRALARFAGLDDNAAVWVDDHRTDFPPRPIMDSSTNGEP